MDQFLTWEVLGEYAMFVTIVFTIVAFTKNAPIIKLISTRTWSVIVAFLLLLAVKLQAGTFQWWDLVLNLLNSLLIAAGANGISDANSKKEG